MDEGAIMVGVKLTTKRGQRYAPVDQAKALEQRDKRSGLLLRLKL